MNKDELNRSINELRGELAKLKNDEQHIGQKIERLIANIEKELNEPKAEEHQSTIDDVKAHIRELEVEHPHITKTLNHIATLLSSMGI